MRLVCVVSAAMLLAATWVAATKDVIIPVPPSSRSTTNRPGTHKDSSVESLSEQQYHWVVTRGGQLANSVYDVSDPDELSRYSEFDVDIKQRRKRKLFDDDVTGVVSAGSAAHRGNCSLNC